MRELSAGADVGNYRIEGVVGRGGMGIVYRAAQRRPERTVALKVIAPDLADDDQFRARFERESNLAAQIEHPNVIPVYEVGEDEGLLYIVMRFVEGTDLAGLVRREGKLAPARAARIVAQVGSALDAAHRRGLVHRDVKPGNVLIADPGAEEHAYLTDFGLVKLINSDTSGMTATGAFVGTLDYLAPEQAEGHADARSDVYALGGVLYNALTGTAPFPQSTPAAKLWAMMNTPPPSVAETAPDVPRTFDEVVARGMAKAADDRYQSAGELGRAAVAAAAAGAGAGANAVSTAAHDAPATAASAAAPTVPPRQEPSTVARPQSEAPSTTPHLPSEVASTAAHQPTTTAPADRRSRPRWPIVAAAIALVAVVGVVLALALGGDDPDSPQSTSTADEPAASGPTTTDTGPTTTEARPPSFEEFGTLQLGAVDGGANSDASGSATIGREGDRHELIIDAKLPPTKDDEAYEIWLWNSYTDALSVGAEPTDSQGNLKGLMTIPADWQSYQYIDVSLERDGHGDEHSRLSELRGPISEIKSP